MVFQDLTGRSDYYPPSNQEQKGNLISGSLVDRFVAFALDALFTYPIIYLLLSPIQRQISQNLVDQSGVVAWWILYIGCYIFCFSIYQIVSWWILQGTPGQLVLRLKVVCWNINKNKLRRLTLSQSILRSLFWNVETLLLGVPHLEVVANADGRPIHDRVAETYVITRKNEKPISYTPFEIQCVRWVYLWSAILIIGCVGQVSFVLWNHLQEVTMAGLQNEVDSCDEVEDMSLVTRLHSAIFLKVAGAIGPRCLDVEADAELWNRHDSPAAYFAKALVYKDIPNLQNRYFEKVCEVGPEDEFCFASRAYLRQNATALAEINATVFLFMALDLSLEQGQWTLAKELVEKLSPYKNIEVWVRKREVELLLGMNRFEKAMGAARAVAVNQPEEQKIKFLAWACFQERNHSCQEPWVCDEFNGYVYGNEALLDDESIAVAYIKDQTCRESDPTTTAKALGGASLAIRKFYSATRKYAPIAVEEFKKILHQTANPEFKAELRQRIAQYSNKEQDLEQIKKELLDEAANNLYGAHIQSILSSRLRELNRLPASTATTPASSTSVPPKASFDEGEGGKN